jgi:hypothetical protein
MTDRQLLQQSLDAMRRYQVKRQDFDTFADEIAALNDRLAHCDRCGKKLGGEGDIHTCTPDPIGDAQDRLIAELAAQPEQEPVAIDWDTKTDTPIMGYATPPTAQRPVPEERKWVGLTDEEIAQVVGEEIYIVYLPHFRAIEAKLKAKNTV